MVFLTESATSGMTEIVTELMGLVTKVASTLTTAPLNYFFYAGVASVGIGLFTKLKRSAKK